MSKPKKRPACPICGEPSNAKIKPFCSVKCADIDLGKWFSGAYVVPGEPVDPEALPPGSGEPDED
ncbi:DNA gyrase inhibitor YacG [Hyphobacterium marinum]|uniref:DNA gyrase inhibitor YacG n=1 Tax=Hyphobacterium marinum TaxID=3116574 RepID=A0ABU7LZW9_9PROT|nr:DNA gyrase inhibitor YacG [Hyphobacterium sp. Y6023]MEE2567117.1 DNA gyrase inhibitor YacG [Hyphobacterium sp. Y6023]